MRSRPVETEGPRFTPAGEGRMGDTGPTYLVYSVSPKVDQDAEYWVPYDFELIQPGTKLVTNGTQKFSQVMAQSKMDGPIPTYLKDYVLVDVQTQGGNNWLVFARNILPTSAYYSNPSYQWTTTKTWEFPAVMRSFPQSGLFDIDSGNLISVTAVPDVIERFVGPCQIVISQWWTVKPWSTSQMQRPKMIAESVTWNYKNLAEGDVLCLHPTIQTPPLTGVTKIRGQSVPPTSVPGFTFLPTNFKSWIDDVADDDQKPVHGRFFREQQLVLIPFDPLRYRKSPRQFSF